MSDFPVDFDTPFLPIQRFAVAINASAASVRRKLDACVLHAVKDGKITKIVETPNQYLTFLPPYRPGSGALKAGPGRGRRGPMSEPLRNVPAAEREPVAQVA
jgi:hypothetical protein